jgi:LPXTG-site transpeptidase (sortase) family protein
LKFRSSSSATSDTLSKLSIIVMALGIAALAAAGALFALSATGIIGNGGLRSGPGTVTGFGDVLTPIPSTPIPTLPTPSNAPINRLVIPDAKVDARVISLSLGADGVMPSPDNAWDVAWYDFSARPGAGSNAVFSGHVDYHDVGPAVFWNLRDLQAGDLIEVRLEDGTVYDYSVGALNCMPVEEAPINQIVGPTQSEVVTLITCCGTFNSSTRQYDRRLVVRADRVFDTSPTPQSLP